MQNEVLNPQTGGKDKHLFLKFSPPAFKWESLSLASLFLKNNSEQRLVYENILAKLKKEVAEAHRYALLKAAVDRKRKRMRKSPLFKKRVSD